MFAKIQKYANSFYNWVVPNTFSFDERRRARVLIGFTSVVIAVGVLMSVANFAQGRINSGVTLFVGSLINAVMFAVLRRYKSIYIAGHFGLSMTFLMLLGIASQKGGLVSTGLAWLFAQIIFAVLVVGPRQAFFWWAMCAGAYIGFAAKFDVTQWSGLQGSPFAYAGSISVGALVCWLFAKIFDDARAQAFAVVENERDKVLLMSKELGQRNESMRLVLDHVSQGLLTIDENGVISAERSTSADRLLSLDDQKTVSEVPEKIDGKTSKQETLAAVFARIDEKNGAWFSMAWEELQAGILPPELCLEQLPKRISSKDQTTVINVDVTPTPSGKQFLVVLTDVTAEIERQKAEEQQREFASLIARIMRDRRNATVFAEETTQQVQTLRLEKDPLDVRLRALHTLKGNFGIVGLRGLASICHSIEEQIKEDGWQSQFLDPLCDRWQRLYEECKPLLASQNMYEVPASEMDQLFNQLEQDKNISSTTKKALLQRLALWRGKSMQNALDNLADAARVLANRLDIEHVEVHTNAQQDAKDIYIDPTLWQGFLSAAIHSIRNSLDHGIESREERIAHHKDPRANIWIDAQYNAKHVIVQIQDDGRGINWEKLAAKGKERGLPAETQEDLQNLLFADGVSSKDEVSEISGRGVGMSALRDACLQMDGKIDVYSTANQGTTLTFTFPRRAALLIAGDESTDENTGMQANAANSDRVDERAYRSA